MIEKDNLSIKIEKYNNQYDGYHFNAKIIFEYKDIILSEYHLDVLSGRFCRIWNSDFTVNLYNENTIIIEIDNEWFDDAPPSPSPILPIISIPRWSWKSPRSSCMMAAKLP